MEQKQIEQTIQIALAFVVFGALAIGVGSMLVGKLVGWYDAWWAREGQRTEERKQRPSVKSSPIISVNLGTRYVAEDDEPTGIEEPVSTGSTSIIPPAKQPALPANLTEVEVARWLAKRKTADTLSANEIYKLVGGNRNEVLQAVREARPQQPSGEYVTPFAGRPTDKKYYSDPELEYQPPNV